MKKYLKQYMELDINSTLNIFDKARLKLTFVYASITLCIIAIFSVVLIASLEKNVRDMLDEEVGQPRVRYEIYKNNIHNIEDSIMIADISLLFLVSAISYILAGQTLKPIKDTIDAQRRFVADASHDLRTPLAIMKTEIEVGMGTPNEYKSILQSNLEEINKMGVLVNDLLTLARSEGTNNINKSETINIQKFLAKVISKFDNNIKDKSLNLTVENDIERSIKINPNSFERVIQNILQNAINYTKPGGSISINTKTESKYLAISVSDTGVGISEKDLPNIFERFYKAEHSRNDKGGSGLGLSIAKQIIEEHKGKIHIQSSVGVGTTVIIRIPIL